MAFISVANEIAEKSFTYVENKFISKYLPVLDPVAIKVYLYSLYLYQSGKADCSLDELAKKLGISDDEAKSCFEYLEEFELVSVLCLSPFEIKILDADNIGGAPKRFKPEKYADFTKAVQSVIRGRMISTSEFREYFLLLEEYGFEQNALIMIISYCVNLKGDAIRIQYIKKVAKSFADEGITTAKRVDEKLSSYTIAATAVTNLFKSASITKQPDIDDGKLYKKWTAELGFDDSAIVACAKRFKIKTAEKLDSTLEELYKNKKFDIKEIEDYCDGKIALYSLTSEIAKQLGVYMQNPEPYVNNYANAWRDMGFDDEALKAVAAYCFKYGKKSFEDMNEFVLKLYDEGVVAEKSVLEHIDGLKAQDDFIKIILNECGLSRRIIEWDRNSLKKWRSWEFSNQMILEAARLSANKSNPMAYLSGVLSAWKNEGRFTVDAIEQARPAQRSQATTADIERHYHSLRHNAEEKAERALNSALADKIYGDIHKRLSELAISLAVAEVKRLPQRESLEKQIKQLEADENKRLEELGINKADFTPKYACSICNDTGYDADGSPCVCMKAFLASL